MNLDIEEDQKIQTKTEFIPIFCDSIPEIFPENESGEVFINKEEEKNDENENQILNQNFDDSNFSENDLFDLIYSNTQENDLEDMISDSPTFPDSSNSEKEEHLSMIDSYNQQIFEKACIKRAKENSKYRNDINFEEDENENDDSYNNSNKMNIKYFLSEVDDLRRLLDDEEREFQTNLDEQTIEDQDKDNNERD